ncbi:MAG: acyl--CoA ligase [Peptococcaceae bacterium]|nr:acyl--CoA ligase [Peptococcaceae bacterium]
MIAKAFYENAKKYPDKTAIFCDGQVLTYGDMERLVNKYAAMLSNNGVKYRDHVGLLLPNEMDFVVFLLAAAKLGIALVPLSPTLPYSVIENAFRFADVKHIIAHGNIIKELMSYNNLLIDGVWISTDEKLEQAEYMVDLLDKYNSEQGIDVNITGDEIIILTLTSGSTGKPKPIILTQKNKYDRALAAAQLYSVTPDDIILAATPLYHSLAERLVLLPLILGGTSVLMSRFTPALWLQCVKEQQVTFTIAVSSQLAQIAQLLTSPFLPEIDSLRCIVSSSALLEPHIKSELLNKLKCELHECYGTSEIAIATNLNMMDYAKKMRSVGICAPGVEIKIVDDNGNEVGLGEKGEIICKTPMLHGGYYKLMELTEESMLGGYFCTEDIGYMDSDGFLYYVDRKKDLIITGGINVYPNDIESLISELPSVKECAAFSYPDDRLGEIVAVAIVPVDKDRFKQREIKFHCAEYLADFQQPRKYFIVDALPRNSMGKLMKHEIVNQVI